MRAARLVRKAENERHAAMVEQFCRYSPAERRDLLATLDRYPDGVTHELRSVISGLDQRRPLHGGWSLRMPNR
jgi:hypothetical protein